MSHSSHGVTHHTHAFPATASWLDFLWFSWFDVFQFQLLGLNPEPRRFYISKLVTNASLLCPHRPPSTAMTLAIPQSEAELLLEDRKGGHLHISRLLAGINTKCLFSKLALLATQPTSKMWRHKRLSYFSRRFLICNLCFCGQRLQESRYQSQRGWQHMATPEHPVMQVSSQRSQVGLPFPLHKHRWKTADERTASDSSSLVRAAGYSSHHSSLTDLGHRRSISAGSASTGIGSILEPSDQHMERGERESRITPTEPPSTPAKFPR